MRIIGISGSLRQHSYNNLLLNHISERYQSLFKLEIISIETLPLFNQDLELEPPDSVEKFKASIRQCNRLIIATPEYNWSVPGVLKNSLDWLSRGDRPLIGKPTMIIGVSTGLMGTIRAQLDLRKILSSPGLAANVLPPATNEFVLMQASEKFDGEGKLIDEFAIQRLNHIINNFLELS